MRPLLPILLLAGCAIPPMGQPAASPAPRASCPPTAPVPRPIRPGACVEDWYATADLPACVKDWVLEVGEQQKDIAGKARR